MIKASVYHRRRVAPTPTSAPTKASAKVDALALALGFVFDANSGEYLPRITRKVAKKAKKVFALKGRPWSAARRAAYKRSLAPKAEKPRVGFTRTGRRGQLPHELYDAVRRLPIGGTYDATEDCKSVGVRIGRLKGRVYTWNWHDAKKNGKQPLGLSIYNRGGRFIIERTS